MDLSRIYKRILSELYIRLNKSKFGSIGHNCRIISPLKIQGKSGIAIGNNVIIEYKTWLAAHAISPDNEARLEIGSGSQIGHFNHIYATRNIHIGKNVLTADRVYISDNLHSYEDTTTSIMHQPVKQISDVFIGEGTWIGEGACIIGVKIGKGCVIGANAVVTKDIPDYCVAVGIPARVIKRYDRQSQTWIKE